MSPMDPRPTTASVPCLVGSTASGKTSVGIALARKTDGEVVCCDAFSVYRHMGILTAAPEAPTDVPHHLVGVCDPSETYSAARFVADADALVERIRMDGGTPWIVGGTALYLRSWLKGMGAGVARDADYRASLAGEDAAALHEQLRALDPERAEQVHPNDERRIVRALEIIRATGKRASAQREQWDRPDRVDATVFGLRRDWDDLNERIELRTRLMFEDGVLNEARALLARALSPEARKVLGLAELSAVIEGTMSESAAREAIARRTRRFARKQMTFFKSFDGLRWIDVAPGEPADAVADRILS